MRSSLHHRLRRRWILTAPSVGARQTFMDCFARTGFGRSPGGLQTFRRAGQRLDQGHPASRRRAEEFKAAKHSKESRSQGSVARALREAKLNSTTNEVLLAQSCRRKRWQLISADRH